ncbi:MAG: M23 family metallopeptidase [Spirochaetales bacterium]|nr:M23 family metallopeptidase [Spirochaetales bacterium]
MAKTRRGPGAALRALVPLAASVPARFLAAPRALALAALAVPVMVLGVFLVSASVIPTLPPEPEPALAFPEDPAFESLLLSFLHGTESVPPEEGFDVPPPPVSLEIYRYRVKSGDALSTIAKRYGVSMDSLISLNGISSAKALKAGAELRVPNMSGVVHKVSKGENLASIAKRHGTTVTALLDANDLASETLAVGQSLFVPGAKLSSTELKRVLGELVLWPVSGRISSRFGYRPSPFTGVRQFHNGIDIVAAKGTKAKAAMDGRVADTGFNTVYGNYVILSHADGYQTWYAHLDRILVAKGQYLYQGNPVGLVGNTGVSTGTHLHFSVFRYGKAIDPLGVLKK